MGRARSSETETASADGASANPGLASGGEAPATPAGKKKRKVTKTEAVRRALKRLGQDATNPDIQEFIRRRYHIAMELPHISSCKSTLLKAMREQGTSNRAAPPPRPAKPAADQF